MEMRCKGSTTIKYRIFAAFCIVIIAVAQIVFVIPNQTFAADGAGKLTVRVQYEGEREDKIRTKATFTRSNLEAMGTITESFTNITSVGGILRIVGRGPTVQSVIANAGIDLASVKKVCFVTPDGSGKNGRYMEYAVGKYFSGARYYYPYLHQAYEQNDDFSVTPLEGSLAGAKQVEPILAIETYSTKADYRELDESRMNTEEAYRFCVGQTVLSEGTKTTRNDIVSASSAKYITGMDVILYGSPKIDGITLNVDGTDVKVGAKKTITAEIVSDETGWENSDLTWNSSDTSIATVDKNGVVTVKKKGTVTITATAENGVSASVVLNAKGKKDKTSEKDASKTSRTGSKGSASNNSVIEDNIRAKEIDGDAGIASSEIIRVKEITLGEEIVPEEVVQNTAQPASDAKELGAAEEYSGAAKAAAGIIGAGALAAGAVLRIRRFRIDR